MTLTPRLLGIIFGGLAILGLVTWIYMLRADNRDLHGQVATLTAEKRLCEAANQRIIDEGERIRREQEREKAEADRINGEQAALIERLRRQAAQPRPPGQCTISDDLRRAQPHL